MVHSFTWSPPPQSPLQLLWFFIHPRPPLHHPQIQLMEAPLSTSTQATTSKGVTLGVNAEWLKTKQNWKIEKSLRGRETFTAAPWRGTKRKRATVCHERKKDRKKERISIAYLNICLLSTQKKCKLGHFWFNYDNKHMRKQQEPFSETIMTFSLCRIVKAH